MKLLIVAAACLAVASAFNFNNPLFPDGRIVGGVKTTVENYPHQCSLQSYGRHICGCSIVNENTIVTAAHCTDGSSASSMSVRVAATNLNEGKVHDVSAIHQHPQYSRFNIDFDVSVLKLSSKIEMNSKSQPIALAAQEVAAGDDLVCTGWGATCQGCGGSNTLMEVTVPSVSREECRELYKGYDITENMICAGFIAGGKDACQGDSGGPLITADGKQLVGIVSWGLGCAQPKYPGVYSNVASLHDYIKQHA